MSALTPHIRVLRALPERLNDRSYQLLEQSRGKWEECDNATAHSVGGASMTTRAIAAAIGDAADQLEAEERAAEEKLRG